MICHREKYASRDKTSQLGLLLVFEQVHCAELGIKGTDRPQQLVNDSKYCPLYKRCCVASWPLYFAAAENLLSALKRGKNMVGRGKDRDNLSSL